MNQYNLWLRQYCLVFIAFCWLTGFTQKATAISTDNPLFLEFQDPLIPPGYGTRELTSFEKYRIEREISQLESMAELQYKGNNLDSAMELWYRQLRLTRAIDRQTEIVNLGKIGAIAWQENRSQDLRNIANRLIAIQSEMAGEDHFKLQLWNSLAIAYQKVRYLDKAIDVYRKILTDDTSASGKQGEIRTKLGALYLAIFDYQNAAKIYQKILQENPQAENKDFQLQRLIKIYEQSELSNKAIATRNLLIKQYVKEEKKEKIPALKMANAKDLARLEKINMAIANYQEVFEIASKEEQLALAGEALKRMGDLYRKEKQFLQAMEVYKKLLAIQQQADNYYDAIDTYDILGKISLKLKQNATAQQFFQLGLKQAETLNYKVRYFQQQLLLFK